MRLHEQEERLGRRAHRADLIGQGREAKRDALALEPVTLRVQRLMQAIFLENEAGQEVRTEHAARRDVEGCRRRTDVLAMQACDIFADGDRKSTRLKYSQECDDRL